jgi:putative membrane protein
MGAPAHSASEPAGQAAFPGPAEVASPAARVLVRTSPGLLLTGQLLSSQFLLAVLGFAAVDAGLLLAGRFPGVAFLAAELAAVGALVIRPFIAEYGFTVSAAPGGLRVQRGLLDRRSSTVLPGRVQGIAVFEPVLWRLPRWVRVEVDVAGHAASADDSTGESAATVVPIGARRMADAVVARVLPGVDVAAIAVTPAPSRARWVSPLGWRYLAAGADDRAVLTRAGWVVRRTDVVPHAKIQSVRIRQGPLQRRLGLADVVIDSPPGPVHAQAKHRPAQSARAFAFAQLARAQQARQRASSARPGR